MCCGASIVVTVFNSCPLCFLFTCCVVMLAFWSPSTVAHFAFCFTVVLRVTSGHRVKLIGCKSALNTPPPLTPRWFPLLIVLRRRSRCWSYSLLLCDLLYEAICFISYLVLFCSVFFSPFSIAITSLGEERANLSVFRTFVRFVLIWFCRCPLPLGVWEGLRFLIVALPGLFSYLFFFYIEEMARKANDWLQ